MKTNERMRYSEVRQKVIDCLRLDLLGPLSEEEILDENPRHAYLVGMLSPRTFLDDTGEANNAQEVDTDAEMGDGENYTSGVDDDNDPVASSRFKIPSAVGISFYVESVTHRVDVEVSWGDYQKTSNKIVGKGGKELTSVQYRRLPMRETIAVDFSEFPRSRDYRLSCDPDVRLRVSRIGLKKGFSLVTATVVNERKTPEGDVESLMFQVQISAKSPDQARIFLAEHVCREVLAADEFFFENRPIFARGRGCAATWGDSENGRTDHVKSEFIPEYEFPGVSASLEGFDPYYFSMRFFWRASKDEIIARLTRLVVSYRDWIASRLERDPKMQIEKFRESIGSEVLQKCRGALTRMEQGIALLKSDGISYEAFCFMNRTMLLQRNISNYARKHGAGIECSFLDFLDPRKPENDFAWRPFQIAFILMNLQSLVDPFHADREIVDLLYFPTGGGKTEAYLGLMAFAIANRRLRANPDDEYNRDGGVTAILRYTLRLLTTQQRDRITKMVLAAELIRSKEYPKYGMEPFSIGFWVGGGVTPNKFEMMREDPEDREKTEKARAQQRLMRAQLLTCPFCGSPLSEENFRIDPERKSVVIHCSDPNCCFSKDKGHSIPVYLVDEEIYAKCPTIILSTVDKFARLPWSPETNSLFGRVDRHCSRDGYVAMGVKHPHHPVKKRETDVLPASTMTEVKPFLPPELIIQDELHLITGPLGTIYGAYETLIEDLCSYEMKGIKIKPKYIASTATIKNAADQTKALYARRITAQFPPNGFESGDSFFVSEIPVTENPFRKYVGVCAPGQSMKTALLRIYSMILQGTYALSQNGNIKDFIDPYYTLVGYYNSIRELGGTVRLLQDDIPERIKRLEKKYRMNSMRFLNHREEITSRMSSQQIPKKLKMLETPFGEKSCLDTAIATNMIAVGMDVDRLGLMVVTGQPKQNSEYIQATSRIGRAYPGLVVTLYNPYRPRDLSHFENFTGYHAQLYRFVEGTTATPFSARARDRVMHAIIIAALRLKFSSMADNEDARNILELSEPELAAVKAIVIDRLSVVTPEAKQAAEEEIDTFLSNWKDLASQDMKLRYFISDMNRYRKNFNRLMNIYGENCVDTEKATLQSMREVEKAASLYYYEEH